MKKIFAAIFILGVTLSFTIDNGGQSAENGKLSGAAMYHDAYRSYDQADAGCEIYAVSEADVKSTGFGDLKSVIERFRGAKYDYLLSTYNSVDPARNKRLSDNFDTVANTTLRYVSGFRQLPAAVRAAANGTGNYTLSLKPGKYYLLVISGSVKSNNSAESKGNIGYKIVDVKSAEETVQNVCFQKHEIIGIMTARNLSGC
ncbi:MAG: hypothetical protein WCJ26_03345 [bacterium]